MLNLELIVPSLFLGSRSDVKQILKDAFISTPFLLSPSHIGNFFLVDVIRKRIKGQGCSFSPSQILH